MYGFGAEAFQLPELPCGPNTNVICGGTQRKPILCGLEFGLAPCPWDNKAPVLEKPPKIVTEDAPVLYKEPVYEEPIYEEPIYGKQEPEEELELEEEKSSLVPWIAGGAGLLIVLGALTYYYKRKVSAGKL